MTTSVPSEILHRKLTDAWGNKGEKPRSRILLCRPGENPSDEIRQAASALGINHIRIDLGQVVTPEQHSLFTANRPRLVAVYGIDRLRPGELSAFRRLTENGPRTLVVVVCPVTADQADRAMGAWRRVREIEEGERQRKAGVQKEQAGSA